MTNYIIDPAVFYWINLISVIQIVFSIFGFFICITGFFLLGFYIYKTHETEVLHYSDVYRSDALTAKKLFKKWMKICFCISIPMIVIAMVLPDKQTCVQMLVVRTATFENINWTVEQVKELIDYIVAALKGI